MVFRLRSFSFSIPSHDARWRLARGTKANGNASVAAILRTRGSSLRALAAHVSAGLPAARAVGGCRLSYRLGHRARSAPGCTARIEMALSNLRTSLPHLALRDPVGVGPPFPKSRVDRTCTPTVEAGAVDPRQTLQVPSCCLKQHEPNVGAPNSQLPTSQDSPGRRATRTVLMHCNTISRF